LREDPVADSRVLFSAISLQPLDPAWKLEPSMFSMDTDGRVIRCVFSLLFRVLRLACQHVFDSLLAHRLADSVCGVFCRAGVLQAGFVQQGAVGGPPHRVRTLALPPRQSAAFPLSSIVKLDALLGIADL
jgi:hypothetical protein